MKKQAKELLIVAKELAASLKNPPFDKDALREPINELKKAEVFLKEGLALLEQAYQKDNESLAFRGWVNISHAKMQFEYL